MPSRRELIRMTNEEIEAYLSSQSRIILVTNGPCGLPHPVPMEFGVDNKRRIIITSFRNSQKIRNLERDLRASLLVESGETYEQLKSVMIYARAEIITDSRQVIENMHLINATPELVGSLNTGMSEQVRRSIAKRVVVRFTPYHYISWDHSKLDELY